MESIGYKVVTKINSKSFGPATNLALQSVRYRIGKTTTHDPEQAGPMVVFDTLKHAEQFICNLNVDFVVGGISSIILCILKVSYVESEFRAVWKHIGRYISEQHIVSLPDGTSLAKSVTPLEKISPLYELSDK